MVRVLAAVAVASLLSGCFVFDEIDKGQAIMEENSKKKPAAPASKAGARAKNAKASPTSSAWWSKAKIIGKGPDPAQAGEPTALVRCRIGHGERFMRRNDCIAQGGRPEAS
jgi:hypothetical protein